MPKFPKVAPKTKLSIEDMGHDMLLVRGCLTEAEARRWVETAESMGFQHQGSRGPAYGEVRGALGQEAAYTQDVSFLAAEGERIGSQRCFFMLRRRFETMTASR